MKMNETKWCQKESNDQQILVKTLTTKPAKFCYWVFDNIEGKELWAGLIMKLYCNILSPGASGRIKLIYPTILSHVIYRICRINTKSLNKSLWHGVQKVMGDAELIFLSY